jgi:hypothetical protein
MFRILMHKEPYQVDEWSYLKGMSIDRTRKLSRLDQ